MKRNKGFLLVISGPAGSGKGTVVAELRRRHPEWGYSVSVTTRGPRLGEIPDVSYHFITEEKFQSMVKNGEMAEYNLYGVSHYGTPAGPIHEMLDKGENMIAEIDVHGGLNLQKAFPDRTLLIMLLPPNAKTQEARLRGRATEKESDIQGRLKQAHEELEVFMPKYDYVVINEDDGVDACADAIEAIVKTAPYRVAGYPTLAKEFFD